MVSTPQDTPRDITLLATDVDSTALTFTIVTQPANGTLSGTPPTVTYTPNANFRGNDTFTFKVNDGQQDSAPAAVGISVAAVNRAPVAASQNLTLAEDSPLAVTLTGTDADGDALTFSVTVPPTRGTLSGTPPNVTYTPNANATGIDTFVFRANDGTVDSNDGTVRLDVTAVNDAPVASAQPVTTPEDTAVAIVLSATDPDAMDTLTWSIEQQPVNGTLSGNPPNLTYTPNANFNGPDSMIVTVSDGTVGSAPSTIAITVTPINDAPMAAAVSTVTEEATPVEVRLSGSDVENEALTFAVTVPPAQGSLSGDPPVLVYTPKPGFTGPDSFSYTASDGAATSTAAVVSINVTAAAGGGTKDTTRLNGWSCGCGAGAADAGAWVLGLVALALLRQRRRAPGVALAAALSLALPSLALAAPAPKKATSAKKKAPAPSPPPATPEPEPAPAPPPPPVETVSAPAAPAAEAPKSLPSLAALDVVVTVPNEKLDATAFTELLTTAVDQSKLYRVISSRDISTMLGLERQRQLLGCTDDTSCLTEIADALGTDFVIQGTVGKVGDTYLVTVRLIDSKKSRVVGRGAGQTGDANLLLNQVWKSTQEALDAWGASLPPEESRRVAARPQIEPLKAVAPPRSKLGVIVAVVGGYQPLAPEGSRGSIGGEVAATWRLGRLDLGAGVIISPTPGARLFGMVALLQGQHRVSVGLRASAFFGATAYGGGPAVEYELGLGETFGLRALGAGEAYGSPNGLVLALLAGLGASARF
jgi:MYXO-CTERM domain-containing protein